MPQGGLTDDQLAEARALALETLDPVPRRRLSRPRRRRRTPTCCGSWSSRSAAAPTWRRTSRCSKRSSPYAARTAARPAGARPTSRPTSTSACVIIGAGMSGLLAAHRLQQAGVAVRDRREERRRRRHVAREHAIPAAASTTRTTTTATRSRSATTGRCTSRPRTCCSTTSAAAPTRSGCASTSGSAPRCGRRRGRTTTGAGRVRVRTRRRRARRPSRRTRSISAVGQLNRPLFPDIAGRDSFAGPSFHSARWDHDVDLRGQAGRGDRHRRERGAVHPRDRAGASASCSCSSARRRGSARRRDYHDAVAARAALAATRTCRRTASGTASGSSGRWATACSRACASIPTGNRRTRSVERRQRHPAPAAHRVPRRASSPTGPTCSTKVVPHYPPGAKRMLRDNGVWAGALKRDNVQLVTDAIREITPDGRRHRRRRRSTTSTSSSTAPASRRRSSSRR